MKEFWDQRYSEEGFAYGTEANAFFREQLAMLEKGELLLPGEGEGRNAVYAASLGWKVKALDQSPVARNKALQLADSIGVRIEYQVEDIEKFSCSKPAFDLVAILYLHLPPQIRIRVHQMLIQCLRPGGRLVLECFNKKQINNSTGGPSVPDMLYDKAMLLYDFSSLDIQLCQEMEEEIHAGKYHTGKSDIIRLVGKKS